MQLGSPTGAPAESALHSRNVPRIQRSGIASVSSLSGEDYPEGVNDGDRSHAEQWRKPQKTAEREREQDEIQPERTTEAHLCEHPKRGKKHRDDEAEDVTASHGRADHTPPLVAKRTFFRARPHQCLSANGSDLDRAASRNRQK